MSDDSAPATRLTARLAEKMARPQRHRLLQGFPAVPAMDPVMARLKPVADGEVDQAAQSVEAAEAALAFRNRPGLRRGLDGSLLDTAFVHARDSLARPRPPRLPARPDTPAVRAQQEQNEERYQRAAEHWRAIVTAGDRSTPPLFAPDASRDLIVGVIPHTQCVPRREACGFCTFPHDRANPNSRRDMVGAVVDEIDHHAQNEALRGRRIHAIYLGGGTANLSEPTEIAQLVAGLGRAFRIDEAELSLEGTPHLFERLLSSHLRNLAQQGTATKRISIGVQTFDATFLRLMGRERFGDAGTVAKLAKKARALSIATSVDLLFNLPGQTREQMDRDIDVALSCGLDQICLYNLVLYEGLGTPWSLEPSLRQAMPDNAAACENWLRLRERLLRAGYVQTTLTNFERQDSHAGPRRFRYELASFSPERTDGLGIGPLSLSTFVNFGAGRGIKLLRRKNIAAAPWSGQDLQFVYDAQTLPLLFLTRSLAKTRVSGAVFQALFASRLIDRFAIPLTACQSAGLVVLDGEDVVLTPVGMFYADAVVATLADGFQAAGAGVHTADLLRETPRTSDYIGMG